MLIYLKRFVLFFLVLFSVLSLLTPWKTIVSKTFFVLSPIVFKSELKVQAKEITRIADIARQITVKIEGSTQGTGVIVEKNGNEFIATRPGGISREPIIIIKENKNIIHLYQHNDPDKVDSRMTITFLDKTHKSFSMIGLERSESTATISGSCVIY